MFTSTPTTGVSIINKEPTNTTFYSEDTEYQNFLAWRKRGRDNSSYRSGGRGFNFLIRSGSRNYFQDGLGGK